MQRVANRDYELLSRLLQEWAGIHLGTEKKALVESRLWHRLQELALPSYGDYAQYLLENPAEKKIFINALTTNKTDWFREQPHFDFLRDKILRGHRGGPLFLWSAACSTGEEVYSLAMWLAEAWGLTSPFHILGSDVDTEVIAQAESGVYRAENVLGQVPPPLVTKYFRREMKADQRMLRFGRELRGALKFRQYNLIEGHWPVPIQFDVIFLRNVLIYFTQPTIQIVLDRLLPHLKRGGHLFIGHAESLNGVQHRLRQVGDSIFRKEEP